MVQLCSMFGSQRTRCDTCTCARRRSYLIVCKHVWYRYMACSKQVCFLPRTHPARAMGEAQKSLASPARLTRTALPCCHTLPSAWHSQHALPQIQWWALLGCGLWPCLLAFPDACDATTCTARHGRLQSSSQQHMELSCLHIIKVYTGCLA